MTEEKRKRVVESGESTTQKGNAKSEGRWEWKIWKETVKHEFVLTVKELSNIIVVELDGKAATYENGVVKFLKVRKINKQKVGGITIPSEISREIEALREKKKQEFLQEQREREKDRPAPFVDKEKFFVFSLGCDTGLIYPESHRKVINNILASGIKPQKVFRGARDDTRKFPGHYDGMIPESYVQSKDGETYTAEGYKHVWCEDTFALPRDIVEKAYQRLQEEKKREKLARDAEKAAEEAAINEICNNTKPHKGKEWVCSYCGNEGAKWRRETAAGIKYACEPEEFQGRLWASAPTSTEDRDSCFDKLMREHIAYAKREGWVRCWECGCWGPKESMQLDGPGYYCGC